MKVALLFSIATAVGESPVSRVVDLIKGLRREIEADGKAEQATYDKFACWCEDTTQRKADAIDAAKDKIAQLSKNIVSLKGTIATLSVDIKQVKKDIAENIKSQEEATALRQKEHDSYSKTRSDTEQATGALKGAIEVLAGAGAGKSSALQEARTLSVVAGVRGALRMLPKDTIEERDVSAVEAFVRDPVSLLKNDSGVKKMFLQTGNNPFGDYAPASTQIQGILKNMYDTFISNLENGNIEEGTKQKNFEELMQTKKEELESLRATKALKEEQHGEASMQLADDKTSRADTQAQLKDDEAFFADTKLACQDKAAGWAERTRLRTEELGGIAQALKTLDSPEARATFESSSTTFTQLSVENIRKEKALSQIKSMAKKHHSLRLASLAANLKTTGHFDAIIGEVDQMITALRQEAADDIKHRDFCENADNELQAQKDALDHKNKNAQAKADRLQAKSDELQAEIGKSAQARDDQKKTLEDALTARNEEHAEFIQALKDDEAAVALLAKAVSQMGAFYKNNDKFIQEPEYSEDPDKKPETWSEEYGGRKSESTGVLAILEMIKEDIKKEIGESKAAEANSLKEYENLRSAGEKTINALKQTIISLEQQKASTDQKHGNTVANINGNNEALDATNSEKDALVPNCDWIRTSFDSRRTKRTSEIEGLQTAKSFLLGAAAE